MQTKKSLRDTMRRKLASLSSEVLREKSLTIQNKLLNHDKYQSAKCLCLYVSLPTEVDTLSIIDKALESGKRVVVPRSDLENKELKLYEIKNRTKDLESGAFGIQEPRLDKTQGIHPNEVDLVIVPGMVFDTTGNRIGRGAGFYDRFLQLLSPAVFKIGLAYSFQVVPEISAQDHDQKVDLVITD